jgi:hypothetical protein
MDEHVTVIFQLYFSHIPTLNRSKLNLYFTWSLTLREEYGLRVFKNRVLRRVFGPKRDEVGVM